MITLDEVRQISDRLFVENESMSDDDLREEISCIVYRTDVFECGDEALIDRHIDIEYSFGEYYEVCEDTSLFQFICELCDLPLLQEEQEIFIYKNQSANKE